MEQAMTLYRANQLAGSATRLTSGGLQQKLLRYAELLTSQGSLETALGYLGDCVDVSLDRDCFTDEVCSVGKSGSRRDVTQGIIL